MEVEMSNKLLRSKILGKRFGYTEEGFIDLPSQVSNIVIARIISRYHGDRGCWFPHGSDTCNATTSKNFRSWKHYRRTQYRAVSSDTFCPPTSPEEDL
jgi:hypothetical protein